MIFQFIKKSFQLGFIFVNKITHFNPAVKVQNINDMDKVAGQVKVYMAYGL